MKESIYKSYDEIPKDAFIRWVEDHTGGAQ